MPRPVCAILSPEPTCCSAPGGHGGDHEPALAVQAYPTEEKDRTTPLRQRLGELAGRTEEALWLLTAEVDRLRPLAAEVERLRPLAAEVERLRPLAAEVERLWAHLQRPGLSEERRRVSHPIEDVRLQHWVMDELANVRLEQLKVRKVISALEHENERLRDAVVASVAARTAVEESVKCLSDNISQLSSQTLEFGPPIGPSLNSQEWVALHRQTRREVDECRGKIEQLWLEMGRVGEVTRGREATSAAAGTATMRQEGPEMTCRRASVDKEVMGQGAHGSREWVLDIWDRHAC